MTDYAKWDKFADDISDDDAPKTQLKLPKARAHSARAFPGRLIACVDNVENAYPHYYDWTMINDGDDGDFVVLAHDPTQQQAIISQNYEQGGTARFLLIHHFAGYYADADVMPIVPIQQWLRRFDRDEPLQKEHLLVVGLSRPFRGDDGSPFELCGWCFASATEKHPVLLDAASRPGSPSEALTSAVVSHLQKWNPSALNKLPDSASKDGSHIRCAPGDVLVLPYRAFGFFPSEDKRLTGEPSRQRLVQKAARPSS